MEKNAENKQEYAAYLSARAEKCVVILKRFALSALVLMCVLAAFSVIAFAVVSYANLSNAALAVTVTVSSVLMIAIAVGVVVSVIAVFVLFVMAKSYLNKLDSLDKEAQ